MESPYKDSWPDVCVCVCECVCVCVCVCVWWLQTEWERDLMLKNNQENISGV